MENTLYDDGFLKVTSTKHLNNMKNKYARLLTLLPMILFLSGCSDKTTEWTGLIFLEIMVVIIASFISAQISKLKEGWLPVIVWIVIVAIGSWYCFTLGSSTLESWGIFVYLIPILIFIWCYIFS